MGVLTHLDMIKHTKKMQRTKKLLKHRFWKEVYPGAKLFYLSDMQYGLYLKHEIKNLARFISVMKFRPLIWQTSHPYILGMFLKLLLFYATFFFKLFYTLILELSEKWIPFF